MSKPKHTPGPWKIQIKAVPAFAYFKYELQNLEDDGRLITKNESEANARLIAASPDMLEALKLVLSNLSIQDEENPMNWKVIEAINKAIAKAEGGDDE